MTMISNLPMVPFIVGILFVLFSILCVAAIFVLCYNWALYFMKNLNVTLSPSSHQQQMTNPNGSHPTQVDFLMTLDHVILFIFEFCIWVVNNQNTNCKLNFKVLWLWFRCAHVHLLCICQGKRDQHSLLFHYHTIMLMMMLKILMPNWKCKNFLLETQMKGMEVQPLGKHLVRLDSKSTYPPRVQKVAV